MTAKKKNPKAASAELAPKELDRVIGGGSTDEVRSQTLSRQEEMHKLADGSTNLTSGEETKKKTGS